MENIEEKLGAVVRSLRQAAGMTQEQLAQALTGEGWAARQNTIAKLENGLRPTTVAELYVIARVFNVEARDIYALTDPPEVEDEDGAAKFALRQGLAMKRAQLKTDRSQIAALDAEMNYLRAAVMELERDIRDLEEQLGEHSEEA
ncbi:helix-turn-helix domain-containing protein [Pseudarthrobacter psychrotolerans]|uniref:Helix-turn-helix domain-containing protein n=1 Tax=Pseudarthrobacter psychrotolerans TaxID=2697569 RepID=A0A6P1NI52_9MICC|nr:helix-turn-helix transcriptional regulator [Pseudarthrobacter psychrotolerans]QHK18823.1 helix-turn-helix domain-containing protein [Pseudarthrobacter psychrotolerans]